MAKMAASNTRVEEGFGTFEGKFYGYSKRDTTDDEDDTYDYRYDEHGPFDTEEEAQAAADKGFAKSNAKSKR